MFSQIVILICFIVMLFCIYMLTRNNKVFKARTNLLDMARNEIKQHNGKYEILMKEHSKFTYNEMLYKFWKPVKSFYKINK